MDAISIVLKLVDQLSAPSKKAREALKGVADSTKEVAKTAEAATTATTAVTKATKGATDAAKTATSVAKTATKAAEKTVAVTKQATAATTAAAAATTRAATAARGLTARQFALGRAIITTRRRFIDAIPHFERAGFVMGRGLASIAGGIGTIARTSLSMGRTAFWLGQRVVAATGLSAAGIVAMGRAYANTLDTQGKFAQQTGFSVQALRELGFVAERQEIPLETLNTGLETFQKRLGDLKLRRGPLDKLLGRVDPKLRNQLKREKDPAKSFDLIVDAMSRVKDPARRMTLATAAFGGAGDDMVRIAMLGAKGLAEMREQARQLRGELGENALADAERFNDSIDNLVDTMLGLRDAIAGKVLPVITPIIESLQEWAIANRETVATGFTDALRAVVSAAQGFDWAKFADNIRAVAGAVQTAADAVGGFENLLIGIAAVPFIPALVAMAAGALGLVAAFWKVAAVAARIFFGKGSLGRMVVAAAAQSVPSLGRIAAAARTTGGALLGLGRRAGGMRRLFMIGGLLGLGSMILEDLQRTREERLQAIRENGQWWADLTESMQNTTAGRWWQGAVETVQQWKADILAGLSSMAADLVAVGKSWMAGLREGFMAGWNDFVGWLKGAVANVRSMIPSISLPSWLGGSGDAPAEGGATPGNGSEAPAPPQAPTSMSDVVNNVDQSRRTQQNVTVSNSVVVNATTNASPAAIGSSVAAAAESGTRRAMGGLHDGGTAGSTYQGAP